MTADALLAQLDKVRKTGADSWIASCPAHQDKHPSLSIRELDDGRVLCHCFSGCAVEEVLSAVGLEMNVLFPPKPIEYGKPERRHFPAADVLRCLAFEALVVAHVGAALLTGNPPFSEADRERLMLAVGRIQEALTAAGIRHG